jgi:hypothetical protein
MFWHSGKPNVFLQYQHLPQRMSGHMTTRSPILSASPAYSSECAAVLPISATLPTISCPGMIGKGVWDSAGVPAYCTVSPPNVCLSVPQIPHISSSMTIETSSISG